MNGIHIHHQLLFVYLMVKSIPRHEEVFRSFLIDSGIEVNPSTSIVLSVIYKKEKKIHKEISGIMLHISTQP
jgi:hypothetical protein